MTDEEIILMLQEYEEEVKRPGRFEGEPLYAPYFWDQVMNGGGDETIEGEDDETIIDVFIVTAEDRLLFPDLSEAKKVFIYCDNHGFIHASTA